MKIPLPALLVAFAFLLFPAAWICPQIAAPPPTQASPGGKSGEDGEPRPLPPRPSPLHPFAVSKASLDRLADIPRSAPPELTSAERADTGRLIAAIAVKDFAKARGLWSGLLAGLYRRKAGIELDGLLLYVLRESYLPSRRAVLGSEARIEALAKDRKRLRAELAGLIQDRDASSSGKSPPGKPIKSRAQIDRDIKALEDRLLRLDHEDDMASVGLQGALQKAQQSVDVIGRIEKLLEDTAMEVQRKMGG